MLKTKFMFEQDKTGKVAILGRRDYIIHALGDIVKKQGYDVLLCTADSEAMRAMKSSQVNVLLLSGGVEPNSRIALKQFIEDKCPQIKLIEHFGGPATLVDELNAAFALSF